MSGFGSFQLVVLILTLEKDLACEGSMSGLCSEANFYFRGPRLF